MRRNRGVVGGWDEVGWRRRGIIERPWVLIDMVLVFVPCLPALRVIRVMYLKIAACGMESRIIANVGLPMCDLSKRTPVEMSR
jgi:hypothetical protein